MAVEDALALADSFAQAGLNESAWKIFEQRRRKKVDWTVSTSWSIGKVCHTGKSTLSLCSQPGFEEDSGERVSKTSSANVWPRGSF